MAGPVWGAWLQPTGGQSTANQTFISAGSVRLLSNYPDRLIPNPPSYLVPVVKGGVFWVVVGDAAGDDALTPFLAPVGSTLFDDAQNFLVRASVSDPVIPNSNNDPASPTYNGGGAQTQVATWASSVLAPAGVPLLDQVALEIERRRGGGVAWAAFIDPLLQRAI